MIQKKNRKKERNLRKKKLNERLIKEIIIRGIRTLFEQEEDHYKPKRINNFWSNNYIEYESIGDKNRSLSLDQYFHKNEPYLRNIIIDLQNSNTRKIQATIAINFISSRKFRNINERKWFYF